MNQSDPTPHAETPMHSKPVRGVRRVINAFGYSAQGLKAGLTEPAFLEEVHSCGHHDSGGLLAGADVGRGQPIG